MYTYYFLSAMPSMQKHLWWKKYITLIQIIQFIIFLSHSLQGVFLVRYEDFPIGVSLLELANALFFLHSFTAFFRKNYMNQSKNKKPMDSCQKTTKLIENGNGKTNGSTNGVNGSTNSVNGVNGYTNGIIRPEEAKLKGA